MRKRRQITQYGPARKRLRAFLAEVEQLAARRPNDAELSKLSAMLRQEIHDGVPVRTVALAELSTKLDASTFARVLRDICAQSGERQESMVFDLLAQQGWEINNGEIIRRPS